MSRAKKWFVVGAVAFVILLGYASYDISRRTTFPGSKSQLKERIKRNYLTPDSVKKDSLRAKTKEFWGFVTFSSANGCINNILFYL